MKSFIEVDRDITRKKIIEVYTKNFDKLKEIRYVKLVDLRHNQFDKFYKLLGPTLYLSVVSSLVKYIKYNNITDFDENTTFLDAMQYLKFFDKE